MSLLSPWTGFFLLLGVVPPLLLLYLLKLRRKTMPISSTLLWTSATEDLQANTPFQRLRRNILMLLQLIALLLLALAIMQPRLEGRTGSGGRTILLIDRSGSMTATDADGRTRLEAALDLARDAIDRLHPGGLFSSGDGETMVVAFAETAEILQPFTDSRAQLLKAIDRIEARHETTALGEALQLARVYSINTNPDNPEAPQVVPAALELFSDGRIEDLEEQVLRGEQLTFHRIGESASDNLAVLELSAERSIEQPAALQVFTSLGNFTTRVQTVDVQLTIDGITRSVQEVSMPAASEGQNAALSPGVRSLVFSAIELARGAVVEVAIIGEDALVADDSAVLVVPPPRQLRVALVSHNRQLIGRVLAGMSLEPVQSFTPTAWADRDEEIPFDLVIFDGVQPTQLPPIASLSFGGAPPTARIKAYGSSDTGQVALQADSDHPVMRHVNIDRLFIQETTSLQPLEDVDVVLEGSTSPLVLAWLEAGRPRLHVAFDPVKSTWPYEPGFVAFLVNAVDWLGHSDDALVQQRELPGGTMVFDDVPGPATLRRPDGVAFRLVPHPDGRLTYGPIELSGLYVLDVAAGDRRPRSVRFPADRESDIRPVSAITFGREEVVATSSAPRRTVPMWPWAIGAVLAMLMLEWWIWSGRAGGRRG